MMKKSEKICCKEKDSAEQVKDDAGEGKDAAGQGKYAAGQGKFAAGQGIDPPGQGKDVSGHLCGGECRSLVRINQTNRSARLSNLGKLPSLRWDMGWQCGVWRGEGT